MKLEEQGQAELHKQARIGMLEEEGIKACKQEECTGGRVLWEFMFEFQETELSSVGTILWKI